MAGALTLEAAAIAACASALAAAAIRLGATTRPGDRTALTQLARALAALLPPRRWSLLVVSKDPNRAAAHGGRAAVLALAVLTWGCACRSPCGAGRPSGEGQSSAAGPPRARPAAEAGPAGGGQVSVRYIRSVSYVTKPMRS
ncbi:hypothetical protein [Streptomyces sp. NPDC003697]